MESPNNQPNQNESPTAPNRSEQISRAEKNVSFAFRTEMTPESIMKRLGDEPYFKYIEQTNG